MWPVLSALATPEELATMNDEDYGKSSPEGLGMMLGRVFPVLNPPERAEILGEIEAQVPPAFYAKVLENAGEQ